jgi:flagellar biosynthesis protein FlhG
MSPPPEGRAAAGSSAAPRGRGAAIPSLWVVAGGKGGVGRSLLVANMGIQLARLGKRVLVGDLDFQGANLHAYLGIGRPGKTLESFSEAAEGPGLAALLSDTSVSGLKLAAGCQGVLSPDGRRRVVERFFAQVPALPVDLTLVDCGSGRSEDVLDLMRRAQGGILVATPEPACLGSLYLFMESLLGSHLDRVLAKDDREKLEIARSLDDEEPGTRTSLRAALERLRGEGETRLVDAVTGALQPYRFRLVLNQVRGETDAEIASVLCSGLDKYFGLELSTLGCVDYDLSVLQAMQKRKPLSQQYPNSPATQGIERVVTSLLAPASKADASLPLARGLAELDHYRLLEIPPGAPSKEIQAGYQILKRAYDPENGLHHPLLSAAQVGRIASRMEAAYRTLVFLESRMEYDKKLVAQGLLPAELAGGRDSDPAASPRSPAPEDTVSSVPVSARDDAAKSSPPAARTAETPAPVPGSGLPVTGATLREHRESRNLALEAIVEKTKIRPAILEALEADRYADLPEPVFLKGHLRQLALCLGLDPAVVVREYMRRIDTPPPDNGASAG